MYVALSLNSGLELSQEDVCEPRQGGVEIALLRAPAANERRMTPRKMAGHGADSSISAAESVSQSKVRSDGSVLRRYAGSSIDRYDVPYAQESRFVKFAVLALAPAGMHFEVSASALSRRWERVVLNARMPAQEILPAPAR